MSDLHISPDSHVLVQAAAAFVFHKGSRLHRQAGHVFVIARVVISVIGAAVAPFLPTTGEPRSLPAC